MSPKRANSPQVLTVSPDNRLSERLRQLFPEAFKKVEWESDAGNVLKDVGDSVYELLVMNDRAFETDKRGIGQLIHKIRQKSPSTQILVLLQPDNIDVAAKVLDSEVCQYAKMPVADEELTLLIENALEAPRGTPATETAVAAKEHARGMGRLVGKSPAMRQVYKQINQAAGTDIPILLLGETGTGKDLVASTIHSLSLRSKEIYIPVNLGSLPTELVASELFGHEKGSFSGALKQHQGVFERATDGTVFLDEVDATSEKVRVSLLRLIETKRFTRLGGRNPIVSNARLITASNSDLPALVREGQFRKDLFYRIDGFRIHLPPLRERREDIPMLVEEFISRFSKSLDTRINKVDSDFIDYLVDNDWPGNIRELKNVVQRAVLVCSKGVLEPSSLPPRFLNERPRPRSLTFNIGTSLDEVERVMVVRALEATDNNRKEAAKLLGISRRAIYNKLKKHGLK